jgi:hypothetical protein
MASYQKCGNSSCRRYIDESHHGNRRYCCHECYYKVKKARTIELYDRRTEIIREINKNENILRALYSTYEKSPIPSELLAEKNMNWGLFTKIVQVEVK